LYAIESDSEDSDLAALRESLVGHYIGGIDEPMVQFKIVIDRIARLESKIDKIDAAITKAGEVIQSVKDTVEPIIDKLSKNPILKGFIS
jgi:hypothetical protein